MTFSGLSIETRIRFEESIYNIETVMSRVQQDKILSESNLSHGEQAVKNLRSELTRLTPDKWKDRELAHRVLECTHDIETIMRLLSSNIPLKRAHLKQVTSSIKRLRVDLTSLKILKAVPK